MATFNPLGNFEPNASVQAKILDKAHGLYARLPAVPESSPSKIARAYYHWTVGSMGMCFADYNGEARLVNDDWALTLITSPLNNVSGYNDQPVASHTYMRNTGAVGIAITGMDGANPNNFGADGVTVEGLTHLCAAGAAFALRYGLDVAGLSTAAPYADEPVFLTHAEAADHVGSPQQYAAYGPKATFERWDLLTFVPIPEGVSFTDSSICGNALRALTHSYKLALG